MKLNDAFSLEGKQWQRLYFAYKGPYSQSYGFSSNHGQMWKLENKKKAEHQRIDLFELWCWRKLLRVPWTVRRSNQSILKEINPEYSLVLGAGTRGWSREMIWSGRREGVQDWELMYPRGGFMSMYGKTNTVL